MCNNSVILFHFIDLIYHPLNYTLMLSFMIFISFPTSYSDILLISIYST